MIEIFNAINALSENKSLLTTGLLLNPLLLIACGLSFVFHLGILYIPFFAEIFGTCPLTKNDWILTLVLSSPVILFVVSVPVLSEQITVVQPRVSTLGSLRTMAFFLAI